MIRYHRGYGTHGNLIICGSFTLLANLAIVYIVYGTCYTGVYTGTLKDVSVSAGNDDNGCHYVYENIEYGPHNESCSIQRQNCFWTYGSAKASADSKIKGSKRLIYISTDGPHTCYDTVLHTYYFDIGIIICIPLCFILFSIMHEIYKKSLTKRLSSYVEYHGSNNDIHNITIV
jgi:hypothetical protein